MRKRLLAVGLGLAGLVAFPASGMADTINVHPGESIQKAVNQAHPGDVIKVHPGVYRESVQIKKNDLTLDGAGPDKKHGTVIKPKKHSNRCDGGTAGFCVLQHGGKRTAGTRIQDFLFRDFKNFGAVAQGASKTVFAHDKFVNNGEYGVAAFGSSRTRFVHNLSTGAGVAGFYVGDSKRARATLKDDTARDNGSFGYFLRDSSHGRVIDSRAKANCLGIGLINTGEAGGVRGWTVRDNEVRKNNKFCPGEGGGPPTSGTGIVLLGAKKNSIDGNTVVGNRPSQPTAPFAGGIVLFSSKQLGGTVSAENVIKRNDAHQNLPADIRWDGKGKGNKFRQNNCDTSEPNGLCS
jgi:Right handed beta helix region